MEISGRGMTLGGGVMKVERVYSISKNMCLLYLILKFMGKGRARYVHLGVTGTKIVLESWDHMM